MRKNKETILLAKVRRYIREAIKWSNVNNGMCSFYNTDNYKRSKRLTTKQVQNPKVKDFYYTKVDRAIEEIAKKIVNEVRKSDR